MVLKMLGHKCFYSPPNSKVATIYYCLTHCLSMFKFKYYPLFKAIGNLFVFIGLLIATFLYAREHKPGNVPFIIIFFFPAIPTICLTCAMNAVYYFEVFGTRSVAELKNNQALLEKIIWANGNFVLYLRSHSYEKGVHAMNYIAQPRDGLISPQGTFFRRISFSTNPLEASFIKPISEYVPVFSLHSPKDDSVCISRRILTKKKDWPDLVANLIPKAKYLIMNYESRTDGVTKEINCIVQNNAQSKTVLITTNTGWKEINDKFPEFAHGIVWNTTVIDGLFHKRAGTVILPDAFLEELKQLLDK